MDNTKKCSRCKEEKPRTEFAKNSRAKDGLFAFCKPCNNAARKAWREANLEYSIQKTKEWRDKNKDHISAYNKQYKSANKDWLAPKKQAYDRKYVAANKERIYARQREYGKENAEAIRARVRKWELENPEKKRAYNRYWSKSTEKGLLVRSKSKAKRRTLEARAMPKWANEKYIALWYMHAKHEEQRTGIKCHVDHIVPLNSHLVCGLHNEFNLQVMFARDNISKRNRHWPDMP